MGNKIKVLVLNKQDIQVKEIINNDLDKMHELLECDTIDITERVILDRYNRPIGNKYFDIVCDDNGLFKEDNFISALIKNREIAFVGNIMITNHNEQGETTSLTDKEIKLIKDSILYRIDFESQGLIPVLNMDYYLK